MEYIVNRKRFNPESAELICSILKECEHQKLYITQNGNFVKECISEDGDGMAEIISHDDAMEFVEAANRIDAFERFFGKLMEA